MKTGIKNIVIGLSFLGIFTSFSGFAQAGYFNTTPIEQCDVVIVSNLSFGSRNQDVLTLQQFLARAGYLHATPNGYFGHGTRSAVQAFQADNYIRQTGTVGAETRNALNERLCDARVSRYSFNDDYYDYASGVTYVDGYDPYVTVVSPTPQIPAVYATPQANIATRNTNVSVATNRTADITSGSVVSPLVASTQTNFGNLPSPASVDRTSIVFNPSIGYTTVITPKVQSLTILTPLSYTVYNEGDTVSLTWRTQGLSQTQFVVLLENKNTRQSRTVAVTSSMNASFTLTKDLLDAVCNGPCDANAQAAFGIVITTPVTDLAGTVTTFRSTLSPIAIKRPFAGTGIGAVSLSIKNPVASNEVVKLFLNLPGISNVDAYTNYSFKIRATCIPGVQVRLGGVECGQDFIIPIGAVYFQNQIPVAINNTTWFRQDVAFTLTVINAQGQVVGQAETKTTVNGAPFSW